MEVNPIIACGNHGNILWPLLITPEMVKSSELSDSDQSSFNLTPVTSLCFGDPLFQNKTN